MLDVIKNRKIWFTFSGTLIVVALAALCFNSFVRGKPMNLGIDFTGGTLINLRFERPVSIGEVRGVLDEFKLGESVIQKSGETDILIRTVPIEGETRAGIMSALNSKVATSEILEADVIGPSIGKELATQALWQLNAGKDFVLGALGLRDKGQP